jgi:hypothetical protein
LLIFNYLDKTEFDDYSQLENYHQKYSITTIAFVSDDREELQIKYKNGNFRYRVCIKNNFKKLKKKICNNFYLGSDIYIVIILETKTINSKQFSQLMMSNGYLLEKEIT